MENNKMFSFKYIIDECFNNYDVYIPLIQRNYKWDEATAAKLAVDLWNAFKNGQSTYTVGMITFYKEKENNNESKTRMQLIDGQQRIVTLFLLMKLIMPNERYFSFGFERDEGIEDDKLTRKNYLENITDSEYLDNKDMYTDIKRFKDNYAAISKELEQKEKNNHENKCLNEFSNYINNNEFINYIKNNVYFLLHISETEPFDEFMNLNKNKTRFVISDRIKAKLIIDSKEKDNKETVLNLFQSLSEFLFSKEDVWELVKQGYCEDSMSGRDEKREKNKHYPDENRLKLLCCERYGSDDFDGNSTLGYEYEKELELLNWYRDILSSLSNDIDSDNWNSYNAFNCLHKINDKLRFFDILKVKLQNTQGRLEEYFLDELKKMDGDHEKYSKYEKNCFIESQLRCSKLSCDYIDKNKHIREEFDKNYTDNLWLNNGENEFDIFTQIYSDYIEEKYSK